MHTYSRTLRPRKLIQGIQVTPLLLRHGDVFPNFLHPIQVQIRDHRVVFMPGGGHYLPPGAHD
jgi:hypothetical protein